MQKPTTKQAPQKKSSGISEQISFRHSPSVKNKLVELSAEENLSIADLSRQIFNDGLKVRYGVIVRSNQIVEQE